MSNNKIKNFFSRLFNKLKQVFSRNKKQVIENQNKNNFSSEVRGYPVIVENENMTSLENETKFKPTFKSKNYKIKKDRPKFKNIDPDNLDELEKIQKTTENSCDRKTKKTKIRNLQIYDGVVKSNKIGKLSLSSKRYSLYRHRLETKTKNQEEHIARDESSCLKFYCDELFPYQTKTQIERPTQILKPKTVKLERPVVTKSKTSRPQHKEQHVGITLNLSDYIK